MISLLPLIMHLFSSPSVCHPPLCLSFFGPSSFPYSLLLLCFHLLFQQHYLLAISFRISSFHCFPPISSSSFFNLCLHLRPYLLFSRLYFQSHTQLFLLMSSLIPLHLHTFSSIVFFQLLLLTSYLTQLHIVII